jgi:hypothetical protein
MAQAAEYDTGTTFTSNSFAYANVSSLPLELLFFAQSGQGARNGPPRQTQLQLAEERMDRLQPAFAQAVGLQNVFSVSQLDCISGIETGRTWNPYATRSSGSTFRSGLFQFNKESWESTGTDIAWDNGRAAQNPETAAAVALALLFKKLGYSGINNPTREAIQKAFDNFGEGNGEYGKTVMDCADALGRDDFTKAHSILYSYALRRQSGQIP